MKRIAGIFLAALLALTVLPHGAELVTSDDVTKGIVTTAYAEEMTEYYYKCKNFPTTGQAAFTKDAPPLEGVTWDKENEVLTLNNAHLTKGIAVPRDATIMLVGNNTIEVNGIDDAYVGIDSYWCYNHQDSSGKNTGDLTLKIKGPGTLTVRVQDTAGAWNYGIEAYTNLHLSDNCTVTAIAGAARGKRNDYEGGHSYGVQANGLLIIDEGCTLNATAGEATERSWSVYGAPITIKGSVTAKTLENTEAGRAIYSVGTLKIEQTANVTAYGSIGVTSSDVIVTDDGVVVTGTNETFVSGTTGKLTPASSGQPIEICFNRVARPTFVYQGDGDFAESLTVTLSSATGAKIYYTLDGTMPSTESRLYESPIIITETTTVKAIAVMEGKENSSVAEMTFTKKGGEVGPGTGGEQPTTYTVTIVPGEHIKTDGALTQNVTRENPMNNMFFYTADGYYFPEGYTAAQNGVTASYMNPAQIMVTGTPTDNVTLTLPEPGKRLAGTVRIVGTAQVGQTLTAVLENGDVDQSALAYQWEYSDGVLAKRINGATSSTYTLTAQDEGKSIFVQVSKAGEPGGAIYSATVGPIEASSGGEEKPETPPRYYYNSSTAEGTKGETKNGPKTADVGALAYLGLALSSYTGTALVVRKKH